MEIDGKRIIVTGASSGIGREIVELLKVRNETKIIAVARCVDSITPKVGRVYPFAVDLGTREGVDSLFEYSQQVFGGADIFIANAGFAYLEKLDNADWNHIEHIFSLNVFSPIYSLEKFAKEKGGRKAFVCTISGAGLISLPYYSLYCSTKSALHFFMQTYRYEKNRGLQLSAVYPVATRTAFFDKAAKSDNTPLPFIRQDAKTVAKFVVKGIEKNKNKIYPSVLFRIFYPIARAFPLFSHFYSMNEKRKNERRFG